ncbi:MAG: hypothetical protein AB1505_29715, partial [Candidatus Latescibacterota bacterium]
MALLLLAHPAAYPRSAAYVVACVAVALGLGYGRLRRHATWRSLWLPGRLRWPLVVVLGSAAASLVANPGAAWTGLWFLCSQVLFLLAGWSMRHSLLDLRLVAVALAGSAGAAGLYGVAQHYGVDPFPSGTPFAAERVVSVFVNPNELGSFAACALPVVVSVVLRDRRSAERGPGIRVLVYVTAVTVYAGLLLSASRGAWAAATAGVGVVAAGAVLEARAARV